MLEKIVEIIASHVGVSKCLINDETNILDFDIDSLCVLKIVMDVEYAFSVRFEDEEIVEIRTPIDILETVQKKFQ